MATTIEGLERQLEESNNSSVSVEDIDDQLQYLLNKTVRRNYTGPFLTTSDEASSFLSTTMGRLSRNSTKIEKGDSVQQSVMSHRKVLAKSIALKNKLRDENKHWWTFADVVPTWEDNIERVMKNKVTGDQNEYLGGVLLNDGQRCIMGESWGGSGWGSCKDCEWLGGEGLKLFAGKNGKFIDVDSREGYEEYKARYEYHWNKYHYDVGTSNSKVPNLAVY